MKVSSPSLLSHSFIRYMAYVFNGPPIVPAYSIIRTYHFHNMTESSVYIFVPGPCPNLPSSANPPTPRLKSLCHTQIRIWIYNMD
jgi:hypothetical protein